MRYEIHSEASYGVLQSAYKPLSLLYPCSSRGSINKCHQLSETIIRVNVIYECGSALFTQLRQQRVKNVAILYVFVCFKLVKASTELLQQALVGVLVIEVHLRQLKREGREGEITRGDTFKIAQTCSSVSRTSFFIRSCGT